MAQTEIPSYKRIDTNQDKKNEFEKKVHLRFNKSDYISAAISFFISRVCMLARLSPFGMAFFATSYTKTRLPLTMLCSLIGLLSTKMGTQAFKYLIAMSLFSVYKLVFDKKGTRKPITNAGFCALSLFIGGMVVMSFDIILAYNVALLILECIISAFLTILFKEANFFINSKERKTGYISGEQLLSLLLIFGICISGASDITQIGPINLSHTVLCFATVLLAYYRGIEVGACAGACTGMICALNSPDMINIIGIYTICGFFSGTAKPLGKYGVAITFALSAVSLGFMTTSFIYGNIGILNFILGGVLLMLCPERILKIEAGLTDGYYSSRSDMTYMQKLKSLIDFRLGELCTSFDTLALSFDELSQDIAEHQEDKLMRIFDDAANKICVNCGLRGHCWEKEANITVQTIKSIKSKLYEKGYADILDVPDEFREKCVHYSEFIAATNHFFEISRINSLWECQLNESRKILSGQYRGFASVLNNLKNEMRNDIICESKYEKKIASEFLKHKISLKSICVFEKDDGCFEVELQFYNEEDMGAVEDAEEIISNILKQPMRMTNTLSEENRLIFEPLLNYKISSGIATLKKDNEQENGDSYCATSLSDNRYAIAISDGMGSGKNAACQSSLVINLLKKLLTAGFDKTAAISLINSALVLKSPVEASVTIDLVIIDLVNTCAEFVKIGAPTGYIKHKKNVENIFCTTLPAGILSDADIGLSTRRLKAGDCIVLMSDGVINAKKNTNWVSEALMEIDEKEDADAIAEIILKEAVIHKRGVIDDDMTVIAAKILDK